MDVRPPDRAQQGERLVVGRVGVGDDDPVDLALVDEAGEVGDPAEAVLARRPVVDEADEVEAVLGVRVDLAPDELADRPRADDHRAPRAHDGGQQPASARSRAARARRRRAKARNIAASSGE